MDSFSTEPTPSEEDGLNAVISARRSALEGIRAYLIAANLSDEFLRLETERLINLTFYLRSREFESDSRSKRQRRKEEIMQAALDTRPQREWVLQSAQYFVAREEDRAALYEVNKLVTTIYFTSMAIVGLGAMAFPPTAPFGATIARTHVGPSVMGWIDFFQTYGSRNRAALRQQNLAASQMLHQAFVARNLNSSNFDLSGFTNFVPSFGDLGLSDAVQRSEVLAEGDKEEFVAALDFAQVGMFQDQEFLRVNLGKFLKPLFEEQTRQLESTWETLINQSREEQAMRMAQARAGQERMQLYGVLTNFLGNEMAAHHSPEVAFLLRSVVNIALANAMNVSIGPAGWAAMGIGLLNQFRGASGDSGMQEFLEQLGEAIRLMGEKLDFIIAGLEEVQYTQIEILSRLQSISEQIRDLNLDVLENFATTNRKIEYIQEIMTSEWIKNHENRVRSTNNALRLRFLPEGPDPDPEKILSLIETLQDEALQEANHFHLTGHQDNPDGKDIQETVFLKNRQNFHSPNDPNQGGDELAEETDRGFRNRNLGAFISLYSSIGLLPPMVRFAGGDLSGTVMVDLPHTPIFATLTQYITQWLAAAELPFDKTERIARRLWKYANASRDLLNKACDFSEGETPAPINTVAQNYQEGFDHFSALVHARLDELFVRNYRKSGNETLERVEFSPYGVKEEVPNVVFVGGYHPFRGLIKPFAENVSPQDHHEQYHLHRGKLEADKLVSALERNWKTLTGLGLVKPIRKVEEWYHPNYRFGTGHTYFPKIIRGGSPTGTTPPENHQLGQNEELAWAKFRVQIDDVLLGFRNSNGKQDYARPVRISFEFEFRMVLQVWNVIWCEEPIFNINVAYQDSWYSTVVSDTRTIVDSLENQWRERLVAELERQSLDPEKVIPKFQEWQLIDLLVHLQNMWAIDQRMKVFGEEVVRLIRQNDRLGGLGTTLMVQSKFNHHITVNPEADLNADYSEQFVTQADVVDFIRWYAAADFNDRYKKLLDTLISQQKAEGEEVDKDRSLFHVPKLDDDLRPIPGDHTTLRPDRIIDLLVILIRRRAKSTHDQFLNLCRPIKQGEGEANLQRALSNLAWFMDTWEIDYESE